jgi:hypothetical protein
MYRFKFWAIFRNNVGLPDLSKKSYLRKNPEVWGLTTENLRFKTGNWGNIIYVGTKVVGSISILNLESYCS